MLIFLFFSLLNSIVPTDFGRIFRAFFPLSCLTWAEDGEEVALHSSGGSRRSVVFVEFLLCAGLLTSHLKFRTHKLDVWFWANPSARGLIRAIMMTSLPSIPAGMKKPSLRGGRGQEQLSSLITRPEIAWNWKVWELLPCLLLENEYLTRNQGACDLTGHVGFQSHPCPDCPIFML